jgi:transmembrane sensor
MSTNQEQYKQRILNVIAKVRSGEATDAEIRELDEWYETSASSERYADGMSPSEKVQAREKMLQRINSRIYREAIPVHQINPIKMFKKYALVAIVLLVAGTSWFFYQRNTNHIIDNQVLTKILPGGNKAILTLANGEKISLTDAVNGQIATQSGMRITKKADGQLVYEVSDDGSSATGASQYNTIEVPVGGQWQAVLSDGSHVWLNALSSITFPTRFTGKERKVEIKGEAYLEVAHNKAMPFKVSSLGQTIEVLGTHFNVMAYPDENVIKTTLLEGSVRISQNGRTQLLEPGEQAQVTNANIKVTDEIDMEEVVAWKNGYFKFDENLESILSKVARWYNVEVIYNYRPDANIQFAGKVSRAKNISALLKIIEFNGDVHFKIEGRRVTVMR